MGTINFAEHCNYSKIGIENIDKYDVATINCFKIALSSQLNPEQEVQAKREYIKLLNIKENKDLDEKGKSKLELIAYATIARARFEGL